MKALIQRVTHASVEVEDRMVSSIGPGLLVLLGIAPEDGPEAIRYLARKLVNLRVFNDENGLMNLSTADVGGSMLVVSQFTLYADTRKGNRPGFAGAADPARARVLYLEMVDALRARLGANRVATGHFGKSMRVHLCNDGPVTLELNSEARRP